MVDSLRTQAQRDMRRMLDAHQEVALATVTAYDATAHAVNVQLAPLGDGYAIPVLPPYGLVATPRAGSSVVVLLVVGQPVYALPLPSPDDPVPSVLHLPSDTFIGGALTLGGPFALPVVTQLPPATSNFANTIVIVQATTGVPSQPYFCQDQGDGTVVWKAFTLT